MARCAEMTGVVEDYSKAMAEMGRQVSGRSPCDVLCAACSRVDQHQMDKASTDEQVVRLRKERDEAETHLAETETSFAQLHARYEKVRICEFAPVGVLLCVRSGSVLTLGRLQVKAVMDNHRKNEDLLKAHVEKLQGMVCEAGAKYQQLKDQAQERIGTANEQIGAVRDQQRKEMASFKAKVQRLELKVRKLERDIKTKDELNAELTTFCDTVVKQLEQQTG